MRTQKEFQEYMDEYIKNYKSTIEDQIDIIDQTSHYTRREIRNNSAWFIKQIENDDPDFQKAYLEGIEAGLLDRQKILTESAFNETHDRAIKLYRKICNEHGIESKL